MAEYTTIEEYAEETALQAAPESGSKLGGGTVFLMILFGFAIDAIQAFLNLIIIGVVLNYIIGFYTWLTFFVWLKWNGLSLWEGRTGIRILMWLLGAVGLELLTAGAAPGWGLFAVGVAVTEYSSKVPIVGKLANKDK